MTGTLDTSGVDVLEVRSHEVTELEQSRWPCPGCGERRDALKSLEVRIRNREGDPLERWVRLCRSCATPLRPALAALGAPTRVDAGVPAQTFWRAM